MQTSKYAEYVARRPTEMLLRQLEANRNAARYRNPETGKRHHAHVMEFRKHFVLEILAMRAELRSRGVAAPRGGTNSRGSA